ncbi:MAG: hypothetical protein ACFFE4_12830 [Candidatus Thorarchaeota archaeon]
MIFRDPKLIALQFNEYINNQDINGLANLMTDNHIFIGYYGVKIDNMVNGWISDSSEEDHAIWTANIEVDKLSKWQIYEDTVENRMMLNVL